MHILLTLVSTLLIANFFVYLSEKIHLPSVVALILAGFFLDIPAVRAVLIDGNENLMSTLGDIALLALMFLAGFESSWRKLLKEGHPAFWIAFSGVVLPLIVSLLIFYFWLQQPLMVAVVIGISMSVTAEATRAQVLLELGDLRTRLGVVLMGAGVIDDIFGLLLFILFSILLGVSAFSHEVSILAALGAFVVGVLAEKEREDILSHRIHSRIFSHFRKLFFSKEFQRREIALFEEILHVFVIPFFFVSIGLNFTLPDLATDGWILFWIIFIAIFTKLLSAFVLKPFLNFTWRQLYLIGWAMNSRGEVGMALALIAFRTGLVSDQIYSALIVMSLGTTLLFPLIIVPLIRQDPKIMN